MVTSVRYLDLEQMAAVCVFWVIDGQGGDGGDRRNL